MAARFKYCILPNGNEYEFPDPGGKQAARPTYIEPRVIVSPVKLP